MHAVTATADPTPPALLRRAVQGDRSALEQVARAWRTRMRRWAMLEMGDARQAEDAAQDAFVRLIQHIGRYDPDRPFAPWLKTVVRNCCRRVRERQDRHRHDALAESHLQVVPDPEHALQMGRTARKALDSFALLTPREREVLHLCTHDGLSAADAGRQLGIAPATARVLLMRARRTLRAALMEAP